MILPRSRPYMWYLCLLISLQYVVALITKQSDLIFSLYPEYVSLIWYFGMISGLIALFIGSIAITRIWWGIYVEQMAAVWLGFLTGGFAILLVATLQAGDVPGYTLANVVVGELSVGLFSVASFWHYFALKTLITKTITTLENQGDLK